VTRRAGLRHAGGSWEARLDGEDVRQLGRLCEALAVITFEPGSHASTFGGNPLAMAAGIATITTMRAKDMAGKSLSRGAHFSKRLNELKAVHPGIRDIRGKGLMIGVEFEPAVGFLAKTGLEKGLLLNVIKDHVLRLVPPLTISIKEIDMAVEILDAMLKEKGL
ncbi:MAG TPA: aminotransferase class III-fold pyridoxal phosphate-dependent enzyme, partial [Phenylobacterium sp.]|nr:aminotransferase class III-fold pyridoxal phosphate-dependent enzyme [Phenylobacterium sp.]